MLNERRRSDHSLFRHDCDDTRVVTDIFRLVSDVGYDENVVTRSRGK